MSIRSCPDSSKTEFVPDFDMTSEIGKASSKWAASDSIAPGGPDSFSRGSSAKSAYRRIDAYDVDVALVVPGKVFRRAKAEAGGYGSLTLWIEENRVLLAKLIHQALFSAPVDE